MIKSWHRLISRLLEWWRRTAGTTLEHLMAGVVALSARGRVVKDLRISHGKRGRNACARSSRISFAGRRAERGVEPWVG